MSRVGEDNGVPPTSLATGEGDRGTRWRGRVTYAALRFAPSTMLRMVPLPRFAATFSLWEKERVPGGPP